MINQKGSIFSEEELIAFAEESNFLNKEEKGDQAVFVLEAL
jgi:hypothetical protein